MLKFLVISNIFGLLVWVFLTMVTIVPSGVESDIAATSNLEEIKLELWSQKMAGFYEGFGWGMGGASVMLLINLLNLVCIHRVSKAQGK